MKKSMLLLVLLVAPMLNQNLWAQIGFKGKGKVTAVLPRVICEVGSSVSEIAITGKKSKPYVILNKLNPFTNYKIVFNKTGGRATATFTVLLDGVEYEKWDFEGKISQGSKTVNIPDVKGKTVSLLVKNHSISDRILGTYQGFYNSNSMLTGKQNDQTLTQKITKPIEILLKNPCNGKATIEVTRLAGTSSAEIVISQGRTDRGYVSTVLKTETIASGDSSVKINLNNVSASNGQLRLTIRNIETNQFIRARIGAWFN